MCVAACSEWSECASRVSTGGQRALRAAGHRPPRTETLGTNPPTSRSSWQEETPVERSRLATSRANHPACRRPSLDSVLGIFFAKENLLPQDPGPLRTGCITEGDAVCNGP